MTKVKINDYKLKEYIQDHIDPQTI